MLGIGAYLFFGGYSFGFGVELFSFGHKNQFTCFRMLFQCFSIELTATTFRA